MAAWAAMRGDWSSGPCTSASTVLPSSGFSGDFTAPGVSEVFMNRVADPSRITLGLAGGYTAGHIMPLIAVAQAWQRLYPEDRLQCYGSLDGIEAELVTRLGLPFHGLPAR